MATNTPREELRDRYRHPGFYPSREVTVAPWDDGARIVRLTRRSKKQCAADVVMFRRGGTTDAPDGYGTFPVVMAAFY